MNRKRKRRCFRCDRSITKNFYTYRTYRFCSKRCYLFWVTRFFLLKTFAFFRSVNLLSYETRFSQLVSLFLLLSMLFMNIYISKSIIETNVVLKTLLTEKIRRPIGLIPASIDRPKTGVIYGRVADIEGEAKRSNVAVLYVNNVPRDVCIVKENRFTFERVNFLEKENFIFVKTYTERGAVSTSAPVSIRVSIAEDITRGVKDYKEVCLTFDGGASAKATTEILSILEKKSIRCTIFLTGKFMQRYPELVKRMVADGHEIGNHTYSHHHLTTYRFNERHNTLKKVNRLYLQKELKATQEIFRQLTGKDITPYWRAPYGEHNAEIRNWAKEIGYTHISWTRDYKRNQSLDALDWVTDRNSELYLTSEQIKDRIVNFGEDDEDGLNGCIILMHLGSERPYDNAYKKLPELIDELRDKGYEFSTVSEILDDEVKTVNR